jgi:predicted DNA-binding transcriptional regulator AlpA
LESEMNQGRIIESHHDHDDGLVYPPLVYKPTDLGQAIGLSDFTVFRFMSQEPDQLPPAVILSKPGALKQKRVWLKTTVVQWLQARQETGAKQPGAASPVQPQPQQTTQAVSAGTARRGRGRPRKLTAPQAGGVTA